MQRQTRSHETERAKRRPTSILRDPNRGLTRRQWIAMFGGGAVLVSSVFLLGRYGRAGRSGGVPVVMYASQTCHCCRLWVDHLEAHGYRVSIKHPWNLEDRKDKLGVPTDLRACHTAEVAGVVVEGHVPAALLTRFLAEKSDERGLAVREMPGGAPGMEDRKKEPFDVIAFRADGSTRVYAHV